MINSNITQWCKEQGPYGHDRLLYYNQGMASAQWWENSRVERITPAYYRRALGGRLAGEMESYESLNDVFDKYVDKNKIVLDGGCGDAQLLVGLCARHYHAEGIEGQRSIVELVKSVFPELPIRVGDVLNIDRPDGYYGAYVSLGVVEHRRQGPEPFLREAYRVLDERGVLLISVPVINVIRRLKMRLNIYKYRLLPEMNFFQYFFGKKEFCRILKNHNFTVVDTRCIGLAYGLTVEDLPFLNKYYRKDGLFRKLVRFVGTTFKRNNGLSNMMLFVCRKRLP